eukprot:scaffold48190_cov19-Tisochrysis_lutea.AAC.3
MIALGRAHALLHSGIVPAHAAMHTKLEQLACVPLLLPLRRLSSWLPGSECDARQSHTSAPWLAGHGKHIQCGVCC